MNLSKVIVGEYVIYNGRTLHIEEDNDLSCKGCVFEKEGCTNDCLACFRTDNTDVIYNVADI